MFLRLPGYKENGCRFSVNLTICGKVISVDTVRKLLEKGHTDVLEGFQSKKTGKPFAAALKLNEGGKVIFDFPEKFSPSPAFVKCPLCGKSVVKGKTAYGCSGWREGCTFRLDFAQDGRILTDSEALAMITSGNVYHSCREHLMHAFSNIPFCAYCK